jgi:hypothetical protein
MSNRTLVVLTVLVILGMLVLFGLNVSDILTGQPPNQKYLKYNNVQGMAIGHNRVLYTLNFQQQNQVIEILNSAVPVDEIKAGKRTPPNIDKLVIYPFPGKPEIVLTPVAYVDDALIFAAPDWVPNGYLMELSDGTLKELLSKTYD